jgi:hypothetical protein
LAIANTVLVAVAVAGMIRSNAGWDQQEEYHNVLFARRDDSLAKRRRTEYLGIEYIDVHLGVKMWNRTISG